MVEKKVTVGELVQEVKKAWRVAPKELAVTIALPCLTVGAAFAFLPWMVSLSDMANVEQTVTMGEVSIFLTGVMSYIIGFVCTLGVMAGYVARGSLEKGALKSLKAELTEEEAKSLRKSLKAELTEEEAKASEVTA